MESMESRVSTDPRSPLSVRKAVWVFFCASLVLALAVPLATVAHEQWLTLQARAMVWPAHPQVGRGAHLVVSLVDTTDQAAVGGPWAELVAIWTMPEMAMGSQQATLQGAKGGDGTFVVPLQLTMPGRWSVAVTLQTPGRPTWHGRVTIVVSPGDPAPSVAVT
jgi:YtkA-like